MEKSLDFAEVRERLHSAHGKEYWRSLEELAERPDFQEMVEREFIGPSGGWTEPVNRRQFLVLVAASLGLAGLNGCSPSPPERILPYVRPPEEVVPGRKLYFATAMPFAGDALGLLVESHEGRPTKIEGNPDHPSTPRPAGSPASARYGSTNVFAQASLLTLYDPERSTTVTHLGNISTWENFLAALRAVLREQGERVRLRVVTESVTSPSLAQLLQSLPQHFPRAQWIVHEPVGRESVKSGAQQAFGEAVEAQYHLERAKVIVALDADFLCNGPGGVRHLHDFAEQRRVRQGEYQRMNRLYVVESTPSGTGALADHRLRMRSGDVETFARALASRLNPLDRALAEGIEPPVAVEWLDALKADLLENRGASLIIAGPGQPAIVHAIAHALNDFLGNVGQTVTYTRPATIDPPEGSLRSLAAEMAAGEVDVLLVLGGNPAYTAPADLQFSRHMSRVPFRIHLGLYEDETAALCHWHVPEAHYLEAWGDVRAHDGTLSIMQPLIAPLHGGRSMSEFLATLLDGVERSSEEIVRSYWRTIFEPNRPLHRSVRADWQQQGLLDAFAGQFETWWRRALHEGLVARTQAKPRTLTLRRDWVAPTGARPAGMNDLEIVFRPDPGVYDGRFANNGWLQELPKPQSQLTWDNAIFLSPATAIRLGFAPQEHPEQANEKVVELTYRERKIEGPLWIMPGHADNSITVHLGYGRRRAGRIGTGLGFDAYAVRTSQAPSFDSGVLLRLTGRRYPLACTQHHHLMENRDLVRSGTVQNPPHGSTPHRITLYDETQHQHGGNQWGMVIDQNVCTGCSACVIACQAENNIPIVGKEEVQRGREMHWLRIAQYFKGERDRPEIYFQPLPCMHCENAPCELVCPVAATVHSEDGLNDMVYNRCVGTRYCSNNCPYKVRRFNFFPFADFNTESLRLLHNPQVTVRSRGVMEKCTYCVQRIRTTQIDSQREDRPIRDFEVMTACQSACPAGAIIFGDLNGRGVNQQAQSQVKQLQAEPLHYSLLEELNTRPRTTYLAAMKNPNPEMTRLDRR